MFDLIWFGLFFSQLKIVSTLNVDFTGRIDIHQKEKWHQCVFNMCVTRVFCLDNPEKLNTKKYRNAVPWRIFLSINLMSIFWLATMSANAAIFLAGTEAELIGAINSANGNGESDTITLTADISISSIYTNTTVHGELGLPIITSNITINGNGFAIERNTGAGFLFRLITINGGALTINNAIIRYGSPYGGLISGGGNILVLGSSTLNVINSSIEEGTATSGAGILNFTGQINIKDSVIQANVTYGSNEDGGGIYNNGVANITNSLIFGNVTLGSGSDGSGLFNNGTMTITDSTISANIALGEGGGIFNEGTLTLGNVTISDNTSGLTSSGIYNTNTVTVNNSIIAGNQLGDCVLFSGTFTAGANNLFGSSGSRHGCTGGTVLPGTIETLMSPLADNGGPTHTHALVTSSPAINFSSGGTSSDQRGAAAVGTRDIGAYEYSGAVPTVTVGAVSANSFHENGGVVTIPVTVTNLASGDSLTVVSNISGGTATHTTDYTITGSLSFNSDASQNILITGLPDILIEGNETLTVNFSLNGAANISGNGDQTITILDVQNFSFATAVSGTGSGSLSGSTTDGSYAYGTSMALNAIADPNSDFTGWSPAGCINGFSLTSDTTCTANFAIKTYAIATAVNPVGAGTASCTPNTVDYGATSTCSYTTHSGYTFANWSGNCTGANCNLTNVTSATSVQANFNPVTAVAIPSLTERGLLLLSGLLGLGAMVAMRRPQD